MNKTLIINSGGLSSRLSKYLSKEKSKSWLEFNGKAILTSNITIFAHHVDEIVIIVRNPDMKNIFQDKVHDIKFNTEILKKIRIEVETKSNTFSGPLNGILTACEVVNSDIIYFAPCDHPYLSVNDYLEMEKYLKDETIVSIHNKGKTFDPNIFVIKKITLLKYAKFANSRITDLYRIIPIIFFLDKTDNHQSLYGVNTIKEKTLILKYKKKLSISMDGDYFLSHKIHRRQINIKNSLQEYDLLHLFKNEHYFLIYLRYKVSQDISNYNLVHDSLLNEIQLWKNCSELITSHIYKDLNNLEDKR